MKTKFSFVSSIQGLSKDGLSISRLGPCFETVSDNLEDMLCPCLDMAIKDLSGRGKIVFKIKARDKYGTEHVISFGHVNIEINNRDAQELLKEKREELA